MNNYLKKNQHNSMYNYITRYDCSALIGEKQYLPILLLDLTLAVLFFVFLQLYVTLLKQNISLYTYIA